jgi:hypothetical protein
MSGVRGRDGKRIARTLAYLLKCPASSVPQAMRACKYSDKESSNAAKQMVVRRAWKAALKKKKKSPPCQICASSLASSVSPITGSSDSPSKSTQSKPPTIHASTPTTPGSRRSPRLKPKPKLTRRNPWAMQKHRVNKLAMSDFSI